MLAKWLYPNCQVVSGGGGGGIAFGGLAALAPEAEPIGPMADAVSALVNLGYRRAEAFGAVAQAAKRLGGTPALESLIRAGLKELSA